MCLAFLCFAVFIVVNAKNISDLLIRIIGGFLIIDALDDFIITMILSKKVEEEIREVKVIETKEI